MSCHGSSDNRRLSFGHRFSGCTTIGSTATMFQYNCSESVDKTLSQMLMELKNNTLDYNQIEQITLNALYPYILRVTLDSVIYGLTSLKILYFSQCYIKKIELHKTKTLQLTSVEFHSTIIETSTLKQFYFALKNNSLDTLIITDSDVFSNARYLLLKFPQYNGMNRKLPSNLRIFVDIRRYMIDYCLYHIVLNILSANTPYNVEWNFFLDISVKLPCDYCEIKQIHQRCFKEISLGYCIIQACYDKRTDTFKNVTKQLADETASESACISKFI
ncbi:unnamed protein product [Didymodactylos carnosus]|uniref:Uncharacterized protein n=1 Tax=Didymodactylos carnosus TaxID=1234261 RepID=A0A8S2V052_9BILA|nr:unnamed protein product [Didymodactylos carnosus]CAF4370387.1 unnamed protein product [Didymodactylos carnosus]